MNTEFEREMRVWDPLVRIGHWLLVAAFFTAYLTEDEWMTVHVWSGYVVGSVVLVRLAWGLVGSRHARFSDFVRGPAVVRGYLVDLIHHRARRYTGHNPAGGAMIVALLIALILATISGAALYAVEDGAGPLAEFLAPGRHEDIWEEVHEVSANLALLLVVVHVIGVVISSLAHRENLIRAMVTGRKRA